jgi:hypothetical protein
LASQEIRICQAPEKESSASSNDSTLHSSGGEGRRNIRPNTQECAMEHQIPVSHDLCQDMFEIGLMAAASPEFAQALLRTWLSDDQRPDAQTGASPASGRNPVLAQ